ncbi:MAG TPA: methyltransferase domain-containing protein [Vicinamibacterales bacterium]|nr:methyltransferase domain-containing protein [Vicinamibacterales bacterium]
MSALSRTLAELLPHGVVRRIAARRAARRRQEVLERRQRELRPIVAPLGEDARPARLNMGCGWHREPGWINADADPRADVEVVLRDGEPLPFADGTLDVVFSEHFLEHLSFVDGCHFLRESQRILRSGGTFRVSCPDLDAIVRMLQPGDASWRALARIYESIGDFAEGELSSPERVVNWAFYGHEHKHIWTYRQLEEQLARAGFGATHRTPLGMSGVEGAAIERRIPEAFYSLIVEATKP